MITTITVGHGAHANALREEDWARLAGAIRCAAADPVVRAVVLTGAGTTFSAGSDLGEWEDADQESVERCFTRMEQCFRTIEQVDLPVVAAVEGNALGAGCQLALACDLVVMARSATLGMPIARLGILASPAFAARLSTKVGTAVAADLYMTGRRVDAAEAHSRGLVARVTDDGDAYDTAYRIAEQMSALPTASLVAAKQALSAVSRSDFDLPPQRSAPSVSIDEFHSAVSTFVHRHDRAQAS